MAIPVLYHISAASQGLPGIAYFCSRRRTPSAAYFALGAGVSLLSNLVALVSIRFLGNNHVFSYITSPATLTLFMLGVASWQATARETRIVRWLIPVVLVLWALLVMFVEDVTGFDLVTGSLYSLTVLLLSLWTLLRRSAQLEATSLLECDWFWVCIGLAIYGASTALASQVAAVLVARERIDLYRIVWQMRAALSTLSFLLISWGIYRGPPAPKFASAEVG